MAVAKAFGARRIIAIDIQQARLDFAKSYVATDTHLSMPANPGEERAAWSQRHAAAIIDKFGLSDRGPSGIDVVYECSGAEPCIQTGILLLKRRGTFVQESCCGRTRRRG